MKNCITFSVLFGVMLVASTALAQFNETWESYGTISEAVNSGGWVRQGVSSHTIDSVTTASLPRPGAPEPTNKVLRAYNGDENLVHTFDPRIGTDASPLIVQVWMYDLGGSSTKGVSLIRTLDGGLSSSFHCGIHRQDSGWRRIPQ
ncbi:MAG TPA: hypothetical protein PKH07_20800 [bacterium]|nr:hypothetical protein [bacterium]